MSSIEYLHESSHSSIIDGKMETHEEKIIEGKKGILIKLFDKKNDKQTKIVLAGKDDKYILKIVDGDKKEEKDLDKNGFLNELKTNKKLAFAADFLKKKQKGGVIKRVSITKKQSSKTKKSKNVKKSSIVKK